MSTRTSWRAWQRGRELGALEVVQPGPEPDERRARDLCLHGDEPLDGLEGRRFLARQQHLPREQGAVEGAGGDRVIAAGSG